MENHIKEFRKLRGLTQKQLADAIGTSQQQIQRIEAGVQAIRFDLAPKIAKALAMDMTRIFPAAASSMAKHPKGAGAYLDEKVRQDLAEAGFDMEPAEWSFKFRLRGGTEGLLPISGSEKNRLWSLVQDNDASTFIIFDSGNRRYAVNPKHLIFCQFLFDAPHQVKHHENEEQDEEGLLFYLQDSPDPLRFHVDPDSKLLSDEEADGREIQLQDLFFWAESDDERKLVFTDVDGETAFFRNADVSMFSAALEDVEPTLDDEDLD
jgi:transcriptional regulator with XRE-family HTH domain